MTIPALSAPKLVTSKQLHPPNPKAEVSHPLLGGGIRNGSNLQVPHPGNPKTQLLISQIATPQCIVAIRHSGKWCCKVMGMGMGLMQPSMVTTCVSWQIVYSASRIRAGGFLCFYKGNVPTADSRLLQDSQDDISKPGAQQRGYVCSMPVRKRSCPRGDDNERRYTMVRKPK